MNVTERMNCLDKEKLQEKEWYSLGYAHEYPVHEYVKNISEVLGTRTRGAIIAGHNEQTNDVYFYAAYKKKFTLQECNTMFWLAAEFMEFTYQ